jgi:hypothetical protein
MPGRTASTLPRAGRPGAPTTPWTLDASRADRRVSPSPSRRTRQEADGRAGPRVSGAAVR